MYAKNKTYISIKDLFFMKLLRIDPVRTIHRKGLKVTKQ